jgi:hypothetical protein
LDDGELTPTQVLTDDDDEEPKIVTKKRKVSKRTQDKEENKQTPEKMKRANAGIKVNKGKRKGDAKEGEDDEGAEKQPRTKITKKTGKQEDKKGQEKGKNRYEMLREQSAGVIEMDRRGKNPCKTRKDVMDKYALVDAAGNQLPSVRIKYAMCHIDKDEVIRAAIGSDVGLVRGTLSTAEFVKSFLAHGWVSQYAGICCIHVTPEVAAILSKMTIAEQNAWLSHPDTLANYPQYIIDGAHRVELGTAKFGPDKEGVFFLLHPSCPFENREKTALSSNALSIMNNTTNFRDKLVFVIKKVKYGFTCKEIKDAVDGNWGEDGAMSQLKQCAETLDLKGWQALGLDYDSVDGTHKKAPVMTIALCLYPLFKSMPDNIRGDILTDIVTRTLKKEIYTGCGVSCRKPSGREQALWVSTVRHLCSKEIRLGKNSKLIVIQGMAPDALATLETKFSKEEINSEIARAVGVGDGKEWNPPTVDNKKANVGNVMQAVHAVMKKLLGESFFQPKFDKEEVEEDEDDESVAVDEVEYREHPVETKSDALAFLGDATKGRTWGDAEAAWKAIFDDHDIKRIHVVTSPPWGVLQGQTSDGQDDAALTPSLIGEV